MSLAGAVRWTLSVRLFTSMVSVGAPGIANSTTSLSFSLSAYATVFGATLIRSSGILPPSFNRNLHFDIQDAHSTHPRAYIATAFSPHDSGTPTGSRIRRLGVQQDSQLPQFSSNDHTRRIRTPVVHRHIRSPLPSEPLRPA